MHALSARRVDDHWFVLRLETSAGLYVKEFVHSDLGRTRPSLGELLQRAMRQGGEGGGGDGGDGRDDDPPPVVDILQLDVDDVLMANW